MIKTTAQSNNKKTGAIAATTRAGSGAGNEYKTCPIDCTFNDSRKGSKIDYDYLKALAVAVPKRGIGFTYSHFPISEWIDYLVKDKTVINHSATFEELPKSIKRVPTVHTVSATFWDNRKNKKSEIVNGVKSVRCPAEYREKIKCINCGGGVPLCAIPDRKFAILFTAHGNRKRLAGTEDQRGGCYAGSFPQSLHWRNTTKQAQSESDSDKLKSFVAKLPPRTIIRHHVAGDFGTA
tara:strand:- start:1358 stop:2065 length:708 start_codon:yes stop_codon:yes gene_type:complete